jgi:hypothetical protein
VRRFRYEYGAGPLHLLAVLSALGVTGYVALRVLGGAVGAPLSFLIWFGGAIVVHDLVLFPLYSLADRVSLRAAGLRPSPPGGADRRPPGQARVGSPAAVIALNHVRVPAALAGLMLLLWFPLILGLAEPTYIEAAGMSTDGYGERWLLLSGAMFGLSGLVLAVRLARLRAAGAVGAHPGDPDA